MSVRRTLMCCAVLVGCLPVHWAMGQVVGTPAATSPYYTRPTVSPYLNLAVRNQFGISNYQTLVRPMLEQQAQNASQRQPSIKNPPLGRSVEVPTTGRPTGMRTATRSDRYMNYSHFYGGSVAR